MKQSRARRVWLLGLGAVAVPVLVASIAYACTSLATLSMPDSGPESGIVSGTGKGFNTGDTSSAVEIHFASRTGALLWSGRASSAGEIAYSFQIPQGTAAGQYAIIATQTLANGNAAGGTPARAAFQVTGTTPAAVTAPVAPAEQVGAVEPVATPAPAPAAAPARTPAVRAPVVATRAPAAVTPAPVVAAPAPVVAAPAPVVAPAPAVVTPAPVAPAPAPAAATPAETPASQRSVMVSMADDGNGSPWLAIGLVGLGLVLSLGATALVVAGRRDRKAPAAARR